MVKVRGYSDDYLIVDGDVKEQFDGDQGYLAFSDGTVLFWRYGVGGAFWRTTLCCQGSSHVEVVSAIDDDSDEYSDIVTIHGDVKWVVFTKEGFACRKQQKKS